ncbi:hypothetical protein BGW38_003307 [Lunasporangiospora selenospora]|uniref:Uncharacterized protein n=1 Tax=Lunasporangiospora selenospora TaxID=979761 RepID=A0A9P6FQT9_9FUNG|nr:hypothetical protein BGW38_003307 [Lunasporangiospora selenospora]
MNSNTTPSSKLDQQQQQEPAAGSSSHSFTDTIKGYVHTAMTKGQEAIHKAQEQISHATHPQKNQQTHSQQQQQQQTATTTAVASNNDAFADVNQP